MAGTNGTASITSPSLSSFLPSSIVPLSTSVVVVSSPPPSSVVVTGPSLSPTSVALTTSVVTQSATNAPPTTAVVVVSTSYSTSPVSTTPNTRTAASSSASHASTSSPASLTSDSSTNKGGGGLSPGGVTAIAVVIPVVVVALLLLGAIFWWRKRKQKKTAQEARRKEVEEYGYNPNEDPTLPAVAAAGSESPEMSEDTGGYRGWGNNAANGSNRKQSTNLSSGIGMAVSDDGARANPGSPDHSTMSDGGHSGDLLMDGALGGAGAAGIAGAAGQHHRNGNDNGIAEGIHRGPSNASSSYSNAARTENSDDGHAGDLGYDTNYSQYAPYRPGATQYEDTNQPVIRDVSARRNTKIENPAILPKQGNSGIAQNF